MSHRQHSLYDSLQIILPYLKPEVVSPLQRAAIGRLARKLPAIHCAGFECRLAEHAEQVDFQQRILARNGEPHRLGAYLSSPDLSDRSDWEGIRRFCSDLTNPKSAVHNRISEFWLEFDLKQKPLQVPTPSVFFSLKPAPRSEKNRQRQLTVIQYVLKQLLGDALSPLIESALVRCQDACQNSARISDIGTMLSRRPDIIRINIGGILPEQLGVFLRSIGRQNRIGSDAKISFQRLFRLVDRVSVCLDAGARIYPQIGLEGFLDRQPNEESRWFELFDLLVAQKLCTPSKRDALLSWPGYCVPCDCQLPWPKDLLVESLLNRPDRFTVIGRRLSHVKLILSPDSPPEAKGYFGFGPLWLESSPLQAKPSPVRTATIQHGGPRIDSADINTLGAGIERAILFLLQARNSTGGWKDFESLEGGSDEWVTAYVGAALAAISYKPAQLAAREAWTYINACRGSLAGWGYNSAQPVDMDSTAWGLRLAYQVGQMHSTRARAAEKLIRRRIRPGGGLSCYIADAYPSKQFYSNPSMKGWCGIHTCVTAAAAVEGFGKKPRNHLRLSQKKDGSWKGYWWEDDEYPTALAVRALADYGIKEDRSRLEKAAGWALRQFGRRGVVFSKARGADSTFATAGALHILTAADIRPIPHDLISQSALWLLSHQRTDGSWPASAWLRIPPAHIIRPRKNTKGMFAVLDQKRIFTTATVLSALEAVRCRLSS